MMLWTHYFFSNGTATTEIYTYLHALSLHDALPIFGVHRDHEALGLLAEFGRLLDFDYIARAEILDGDDMAEHGAIGRNARQTDQIVMIIFALAQRRQRRARDGEERSEEHTSELQSLMRISYAVFCLKKKKTGGTQYNAIYRV